MECVNINDAKMMISLDKNDADYLFPGSPTVQTILRSITPGLLICGFGTSRDVIGYEVFEGTDGGYVIFATNISKILLHKEGGDDLRFSEGRQECDLYALTKERATGGAMYSFRELEDLLGACRALSRSEAESCAYYDETESLFYLFLSEDSPIPPEFLGEKIPYSMTGAITERSKLIAQNAHVVLAPLARNGAS